MTTPHVYPCVNTKTAKPATEQPPRELHSYNTEAENYTEAQPHSRSRTARKHQRPGQNSKQKNAAPKQQVPTEKMNTAATSAHQLYHSHPLKPHLPPSFPTKT